jgi:hypothetical protein
MPPPPPALCWRRVISSGKLVVQGPAEFVLPFFQGLGFACPRMKGTADFLQEVNTFTDQEVCWPRRGGRAGRGGWVGLAWGTGSAKPGQAGLSAALVHVLCCCA